MPEPTSINCAMSSTGISPCRLCSSTVTITIDSQESNDSCQNVLIATGIIGLFSFLLLIVTIVSLVVVFYQCLNRR